jgi:hypothetical protein
MSLLASHMLGSRGVCVGSLWWTSMLTAATGRQSYSKEILARSLVLFTCMGLLKMGTMVSFLASG